MPFSDVGQLENGKVIAQQITLFTLK